MGLLVRRPDAARRAWRGLGFLFGGGGGRGEARVSDSGAPNPDFSILGGCAAARGAQTILSPCQRIGPAIQRTNAKEAIRGAAAARGLGGQRLGFDGVARLGQSGSRHVPGQESIVVVKLRSHFRTFSISGRTRAFATVRNLHRANSVDICRWSEIVGVSISDNLRQNGIPGLADGFTRNIVLGHNPDQFRWGYVRKRLVRCFTAA